MLKSLRCSLCDYGLDEEDQSVGYCSVCGEKIKSNEVNKMGKKGKKKK